VVKHTSCIFESSKLATLSYIPPDIKPESTCDAGGGIGGKTGLDGGGVDVSLINVRDTGGEDPISGPLSSEKAAGVMATDGDLASSSLFGGDIARRASQKGRFGSMGC
jgi:hypothetical protein